MALILVAARHGTDAGNILDELRGAGVLWDEAEPRHFSSTCRRFLPSLLEQTWGPAYELAGIDLDLRTRISEAFALAAARLGPGNPGRRRVVRCERLLFFLPFLLELFPDLCLLQVTGPERSAPAPVLEWRESVAARRRRSRGSAAPVRTWSDAHKAAADVARSLLGARHLLLGSGDPEEALPAFLQALEGTAGEAALPSPGPERGGVEISLEETIARPLAPQLALASYRPWIDRIEPQLRARAVSGDTATGTAGLAIVFPVGGPDPDQILGSANSFHTAPSDYLRELWADPAIEWVLFVEPGCRLAEGAADIVRAAVGRAPEAVFLHGDFDCLDADGNRVRPVFKTAAWDEDLALQARLLRGCFAIRRSLGERLPAPVPGMPEAMLYELGLLASELAGPEAILHVPHVLAHLPEGASGPDPDLARVLDAVRGRAIGRRGWDAELRPGPSPLIRHLRFPVRDPAPTVSVIVPTRDGGRMLARCLQGLREATDYPALEILVVDNGSRDPFTLECLDGLAADPRCRVIRHDRPFNFAEIMNLGVSEARGELVCMLNDDVLVLHAGWLREMVGLALRSDVGIVGALLLFEDGTVQHAGVTLGLVGQVAGHDYHYEPESRLRRHLRSGLVRQTSAVTGACAVLRREVYMAAGGMDAEHLAVNYNDLDLCLKIGEAGLKVLWTPYARLVHAESATRGKEAMTGKMARSNAEGGYIASRWQARIRNDPFTSPNLSLESPAFELSFVLAGAGPSTIPPQQADRQRLLEDAREVAASAGILPDNLAFHAAKIAFHRGHDDLAARLTLEAVLEAPEAYTANLVAGTCLAKTGDLERAYIFYRNASLISPQAVRPWLYRGLLAERLGRADDAVECLSETLRHDPFNERAKQVLERLGQQPA